MSNSEHDNSVTRLATRRYWRVWLAFCLLWSCGGCLSLNLEVAKKTAYVVSWSSGTRVGTRAVKRAANLGPIGRWITKPPKPSERTAQMLRQFALESEYKVSPDKALGKLQTLANSSPTLDRIHAVSELAYQQGEWAMRMGRSERANEMFGTALVEAHRFLFDEAVDLPRNAFDPQFRSICDIYNRSLEELIRYWIKEDQLQVGKALELKTSDTTLRFQVNIPGRWQREKIERFELVNSYEPVGVDNHYRTFGLGVPLIAVRQTNQEMPIAERHYPPGLTMSLTAFLNISSSGQSSRSPEVANLNAELTLHDPLEQTVINVHQTLVPLESDITTPMAHFLDNPLLSTNVLPTFALLNADFAKQYHGIYMLEPYDPEKIPVVMIHGLWSSPVTWLEMFNDLRADPEIHRNFQFWFCLYPTGQPFWESARQVRENLAELRGELKQLGPTDACQEMVLVGHSMGGLVARMLTTSSENHFWSIVSDEPFSALEGDPDSLQRLRQTFFFEPVAEVRRVITIGSPHHGSSFANETTRWLSQKLFSLPSSFTHEYSRIARQNQERLKDAEMLTVSTSIDSLSPDCPVFVSLQQASPNGAVSMHTIYGRLESNSPLSKLIPSEPSDGIVSVESAQLPGSVSQIEVQAEHSVLHQDPRSILEVKRILYEHLRESRRLPENREFVLPTAHQMLEPMMPAPAVRR